MMDHYKTLELDNRATEEAIKNAFRRLAKKYHPDVNPNNKEAEQKFKEINDAYSTLSDETKKAEYDRKMYGRGQQDYHDDTTTVNHGTAYRPDRNMTAEDFTHARSAFEEFFGFDPKSNSPELKKGNKNVRPMKTKDAFGVIFGKKRF